MLPQSQTPKLVLREQIPNARLVELEAVAEPVDTVLVVVETAVDRDPLDPWLEIGVLLDGFRHVDL